jgi:soluble lytic murein transglycosylase-like protein
LPLLGCVLAGAPNGEPPEDPLSEPQLTAAEKQRASVQLQLQRIREASARRTRPSAASILQKQRAAAERQRDSVARQMLAVRPEPANPATYARATYTAVARPVVAPAPVASWTGPASPECQRIAPTDINNYVERVAERESLTPELLHGVISQESSFFPCAISNKGAMGMMQLMPGTAADLGVTNPFNAKENIDGGARYLGYLMQRFGGDLRLALAAYNAGPGRVDNYRGVPPFPETVDYVSKILGRLPAETWKPAVRTTPAKPTSLGTI